MIAALIAGDAAFDGTFGEAGVGGVREAKRDHSAEAGAALSIGNVGEFVE